jgi:hypothetical protein
MEAWRRRRGRAGGTSWYKGCRHGRASGTSWGRERRRENRIGGEGAARRTLDGHVPPEVLIGGQGQGKRKINK